MTGECPGCVTTFHSLNVKVKKPVKYIFYVLDCQHRGWLLFAAESVKFAACFTHVVEHPFSTFATTPPKVNNFLDFPSQGQAL
jgi:hypothetical protein